MASAPMKEAGVKKLDDENGVVWKRIRCCCFGRKIGNLRFFGTNSPEVSVTVEYTGL
jgi:hypothetical protein